MIKLVLLVSSFLMGMVHARTELEIRQWFMELGIECIKDNSLNGKEINLLFSHQLPDSENVRCFLACVYQKAKWLSDKGIYDYQAAIDMFDKDNLDEPKKRENAKLMLDECKTVNDLEVKDNEKGCDRAGLLAKCFFDNAVKYDIKF